MKPLLAPCFTEVTAFTPLAISLTTSSKETLGFLGGRSLLDGYFLFIDGLLEPVPLGSTSLDSFFLAAWALIIALLLALSIYV